VNGSLENPSWVSGKLQKILRFL